MQNVNMCAFIIQFKYENSLPRTSHHTFCVIGIIQRSLLTRLIVVNAVSKIKMFTKQSSFQHKGIRTHVFFFFLVLFFFAFFFLFNAESEFLTQFWIYGIERFWNQVISWFLVRCKRVLCGFEKKFGENSSENFPFLFDL